MTGFSWEPMVMVVLVEVERGLDLVGRLGVIKWGDCSMRVRMRKLL